MQTDLLEIWEEKNRDKEIQYAEIEKQAKIKLGLSKKTVINYLQNLVANKILERRVDENRRVFYKISPGKGQTRRKKESIKKELEDESLEWIKSHVERTLKIDVFSNNNSSLSDNGKMVLVLQVDLKQSEEI